MTYLPRFTTKAERKAQQALPPHEREHILYNMTDLKVGFRIEYPGHRPAASTVFTVLAISGSVVTLGLPEEL